MAKNFSVAELLEIYKSKDKPIAVTTAGSIEGDTILQRVEKLFFVRRYFFIQNF